MLLSLLTLTTGDLQGITEEEEEILRFWEETLREREESPFTFYPPREDIPNYAEPTCSVECPLGTCSAYCSEGASCVCSETGAPLCKCKTSRSEGGEDLTLFSLPSGLKIASRSGSKPLKVEVWDVSGRLVKRVTLRGSRVLHLRPGVYFIRSGGTVKKAVVR